MNCVTEHVVGRAIRAQFLQVDSAEADTAVRFPGPPADDAST